MQPETALITGASSGIGLETARLFAADRVNLLLVARSEDQLNQLAEELCRNHGIDVFVLPLDLSRPESPGAVFDHLRVKNITPDVLVNNAGFGELGNCWELPAERQLSMIQVNITT